MHYIPWQFNAILWPFQHPWTSLLVVTAVVGVVWWWWKRRK